jgi:predicted Rossmann-fold nucleotide-binding protein
MDELFEVVTLIQTAKMKKKLAMVIYDKNYWNNIINFEHLVEQGMISKSDLRLFSICNSIDEAYNVIVKHLNKYYTKQKEPEVIEPVLKIK